MRAVAMPALAVMGWMLAAAAPLPPDAPAGTAPAAHPRTPARSQPHRHHRHRRQATEAGKVTAPAPGARPSDGLEPAPVPNRDVGPPAAPAPTGAEVTGERLQIHYPPVGDGFLPGSSSTVIDNARAAKVPGVQVKIPVEHDPAPAPP